MEVDQRSELIEHYKDGYDVVAAALHELTDDELDYQPEPGEWTAREIVHHLADSEMTSAMRLRRLIVEDQPEFEGYDQETFARQLYYQNRPLEASLLAFKAARLTSAELLDRMSEKDWASAGMHNESGDYSVDTWLEIYAAHAHEHADQINRNRVAARSTARSAAI